MEITRDTFFKFLKDNNFYDEWIEAYNLDNEIYGDEVTLEEFFEKGKDKVIWFYNGIGELAYHPRETTDESLFDLRNRWIAWRKRNNSKCMELDEKWMDFVNKNNSLEERSSTIPEMGVESSDSKCVAPNE